MEISINDLNTYQLPSNCFSSHYKILSFLGEGSYGKVFKAREISTGRVLAVKKIQINNSLTKYKKTIKEINLLKNLDHPNIVKFYDFFEEEENIYLMMEFLEGCTLKQYIQKTEIISENNARIIIKQLLTALSYLHYACDICHRDIKPENIMFKEKNDINSLKLLDFGLSLENFESKNYLENCGTLVYMAPELLINNIKYTKGVDVWSVGIILYMLLMKGKNPFYNRGDSKETVIKNIRNNNVIFNNDINEENNISNMGKDLINKLLKKNPLYRYTIRSALEHPWITLKKFDKIPLTIYDKANIDENVEKIKIFLLVSIFLNYVKKNKLFFNEENSNEKNYNISDKNNISNFEIEFGTERININKKKIKSSKEIRNKEKFNMDEYEKMVKYSNRIYHLKFIQDREIMFNPKLLIKKNSTNNSILNLILQKKENKKLEENSSTIFNNESLDHKNNIKLKTPFKLRTNLLESNKINIQKTKLKRKFSAMPKIINNKIYNNNNSSFIKNLKNKIDYKKNEINLFVKQIEKKKKIRTNSAKNVDVYFQHVDRSMNVNNYKNKKWFKKDNLIFMKKGNNNKNEQKKFLSKKIQKHIIDVKIVMNNHEKDKNTFRNNNQNLLSITELSQNNISNNNNHKKIKKKFPIIMQ
jgi:calcium-dependent protein kinase